MVFFCYLDADNNYISFIIECIRIHVKGLTNTRSIVAVLDDNLKPSFSGVVNSTVDAKVEKKILARLERALFSSFGGDVVEYVLDRFRCTRVVERKTEKKLRKEKNWNTES